MLTTIALPAAFFFTLSGSFSTLSFLNMKQFFSTRLKVAAQQATQPSEFRTEGCERGVIDADNSS
jgi:hypothetical protein